MKIWRENTGYNNFEHNPPHFPGLVGLSGLPPVMLPCSIVAVHLARTQQQHLTRQAHTEAMRGPGHMASPLLVILLLVRNVGAQRQAVCESDYVSVWSSQQGTTLAGCYGRNSYFVAHGRPVYTKTGGAVGSTTYGVLGSQVSTCCSPAGVEGLGLWRRRCLVQAGLVRRKLSRKSFCSALLPLHLRFVFCVFYT